jgi:hypothetical protein
MNPLSSPWLATKTATKHKEGVAAPQVAFNRHNMSCFEAVAVSAAEEDFWCMAHGHERAMHDPASPWRVKLCMCVAVQPVTGCYLSTSIDLTIQHPSACFPSSHRNLPLPLPAPCRLPLLTTTRQHNLLQELPLKCGF